MSWGDNLDFQRSSLRWDIKRTMNNLCKKLCDIGEECFVVTVNASNGVVGHMGSVRGSEFINDKTYIPYSFLEYCRESVDMSPEYSISDTDSASEDDDIADADDQTPIVLSVPFTVYRPSNSLPTEEKKENQQQEKHLKQQPENTEKHPIHSKHQMPNEQNPEHSKQQPVHSEKQPVNTKQQAVTTKQQSLSKQSLPTKPLTFFQRKMLHLNSTPVKEYRKPGRPRKSTANTMDETDSKSRSPTKRHQVRRYDTHSSTMLYTENKQRLKLRSNIEQNVLEMYKQLKMPIDFD